MEIELAEIRDFLAEHDPYTGLDSEALNELAQAVVIRYFRSETEILSPGIRNDEFYMVRSGAVEIRAGDQLLARAGEGEHFGFGSLRAGEANRYQVTAVEDTLCYALPAAWLRHLVASYPAADLYFEQPGSRRLRRAALFERQRPAYNSLISASVMQLVHREPVTLDIEHTAKEAADLMCAEEVSILLVTQNGQLAGIVNDKDLRSRLIAAGRPYETPVAEIMTTQPHTLNADSRAFEAMLMMMKNNVHQLPIVEEDRIRGVISVSDLVQFESHGSIYLISDIEKQKTLEGLAGIARQMRQTLVHLRDSEIAALALMRLLSSISEAVHRRVAELVEAELGPPPASYCLLVMGSLAREEQLILADQDHGIILGPDYRAERDAAYFEAFAQRFSDGLAQCGYPYCKGGIMCSNPQWRVDLPTWQGYFEQWVNHPTARALLNASIFFDFRPIHGDDRLAEELHGYVRELALGKQRFFSYLARNAVRRKPPIGFFRQFIVEKSGQHRDAIDLKGRGTAPITDIARVHGLAAGSRSVNTKRRIDAAVAERMVTAAMGRDMIGALEYISHIRIDAQAELIRQNRPLDNYLRPAGLPNHSRRRLRDAFLLIARMQDFLHYRYSKALKG
jgi:CBS domain-containing protein